MKKYKLILIVVLFLNCDLCLSQNKFILNKTKYNLNDVKVFLKDYQLMAIFKNYTNSKNEFQFAYIVESKRNDSLFISGRMKIIGRKIFCTEKYFFNYFEKDSIKRVYRQNKTGKVVLESYKEYKNGKITIEHNY